MNNLARLAALADDWTTHKRIENNAITERRRIERQMSEIMGTVPEGTLTERAGEFKVSVTYKLNRKLDVDAWREIRDEIPENLVPVSIVEKFEIDKAMVCELEKHEPDVYRTLCRAMTVKSATPYFKVTEKS